jgi:hypothetical protein
MNSASVIKTIGNRLFLFPDLHDFSINRLFRVGTKSSLNGRILDHLLFLQCSLRKALAE